MILSVLVPSGWKITAPIWKAFDDVGLTPTPPEQAKRIRLKPDRISEFESRLGLSFNLTDEDMRHQFLLVELKGDLEDARTQQALRRLHSVKVGTISVRGVSIPTFAGDHVVYAENAEQEAVIREFFHLAPA